MNLATPNVQCDGEGLRCLKSGSIQPPLGGLWIGFIDLEPQKGLRETATDFRSFPGPDGISQQGANIRAESFRFTHATQTQTAIARHKRPTPTSFTHWAPSSC